MNQLNEEFKVAYVTKFQISKQKPIVIEWMAWPVLFFKLSERKEVW